MTNKGFSHVGLSTLDLDRTRDFYESVLGFKAVRCDVLKVKEGGQIRHIFFDTGRDQLLAFMEARGVPGVPTTYDAGINRGLGVPGAFYHFAFEAGSEAALQDRRRELLANGVEVTDVVDHDRQSLAAAARHPQSRRRGRPHAGSRRDLAAPAGARAGGSRRGLAGGGRPRPGRAGRAEPGLAACHRADHQERLAPGHDRLRKGRVGRVVGKILLAREEAQERAALPGDLIADGSAQHGVRGLQRVQHPGQRHRRGDLHLHLPSHARQRPQVRREHDPDHATHVALLPPPWRSAGAISELPQPKSLEPETVDRRWGSAGGK